MESELDNQLRSLIPGKGFILGSIVVLCGIGWFFFRPVEQRSANPWAYNYDPSLNSSVTGSTTAPPPLRLHRDKLRGPGRAFAMCLDYSSYCTPGTARQMAGGPGRPSVLSASQQRALREQAESGLFWKYNPIGRFLSSLGSGISGSAEDTAARATPASRPGQAGGGWGGEGGSGELLAPDEEAARASARSPEMARAILDKARRTPSEAEGEAGE